MTLAEAIIILNNPPPEDLQPIYDFLLYHTSDDELVQAVRECGPEKPHGLAWSHALLQYEKPSPGPLRKRMMLVIGGARTLGK